MRWYDEAEALTEELVGIKSVTEAPGEEQRLAEHIFAWYKSLPGMDDPQSGNTVLLAPTEGDTLKRSSVIALIRGAKGGRNPETVILLGHLDTVDVQDYGALKTLATRPEELRQALADMGPDPGALEDVKSGRYMFGRGALDMKSGVAAQMCVMRYFAAHPDELRGNLIAVCECDEEGNSAGVFSALKYLARLKEELGLDYAACVNSDYSTAERDDERRYVYIGSVGKLLPCFAVFGREAHAGQPFASFDPNLVTAEITRRVCYSAALCDPSQGELTLPPVSLKQSDTKESYTVQTALSSFSYYNVFMYGMGPGEVLEKCRKIAEEAMEAAIALIKENHAAWQRMADRALPPLAWKTRVRLWSEYRAELEEKLGPGFSAGLEAFREKLAQGEPSLDLRLYSLKVCEEARRLDPDKSPLVVIFPASTYYPRVEISGKSEKEKALMKAVRASAAEESARAAAKEEGARHPIEARMFYPYISDSSFMYVCEGSGASDSGVLSAEMPAWGVRYEHPEALIAAVGAPVVNIGSFGYDGHMFTERVEKEHSFEAVPRMIMRTVRELLG